MMCKRKLIIVIIIALCSSVSFAESPLIFQGLFDMRFVSSSTSQGGRTRFNSESRGFDIGRLAFAVSKEVKPGVDFYTQLDFRGTMNSLGARGVLVNEAWLKFNPFVGRMSGRFGSYALPFSLAYGEPMRTTTWTITPSALDTFFEGIRITGMEVSKGYEVPGHHFNWQFGGGSGVDNVTLYDYSWRFSEEPPVNNGFENDGSMAFYGYIGKFRSNSCKRGRLSWHTGFFINNAQNGDDTQFVLFDAQFWKPYWGIVVQGMLGASQRGNAERETDVSQVSLWAKVDRRLSGFLRYDHFNLEDTQGNAIDRGHGITLAWSYKVRKGELLQAEWMEPSVSVGSGQSARTQWQLRYRVTF